jgi:hypothetical protein
MKKTYLESGDLMGRVITWIGIHQLNIINIITYYILFTLLFSCTSSDALTFGQKSEIRECPLTAVWTLLYLTFTLLYCNV